jgi:hypothetical protein
LIAALGALARLLPRRWRTDISLLSMACHLKAIRLFKTCLGDLPRAEEEAAARNKRLKWSARAIGGSAATLATGAVFLVLAIVVVLWPK